VIKIYLLIISLLCPLASVASPEPLTLADARHLLNRTGIGASPNEINEFLGLTRLQAVTKIVTNLRTKPESPPPAWTKKVAPNHWHFQELSTNDRQKFRTARNNEIQSLRRWWVSEMISTSSPQTERLLLLWHNHFATGYSGINNQSISIARQHAMFRKFGSGNFRDLFQQIIRDPAMLNYLDNNNSVKAKPNENLARELMELFTLGEGNYTEQDIKNAARALTGYSFEPVYDQRFIFKRHAHDSTEKTIFGKTGKFDGDDLIDLILEKPQAATFIAAKFWRVLVGDANVDDSRITAHADAFRQSNYDIKTLYQSILLSEDFWHTDNRATIVQSPVELVIGTMRSTGIIPASWQTLPSMLAQMGQQLFDPPNVAGWPGGKAWIAPGRLLTRLEWLKSFANETSIAAETTNTMDMMSQSNVAGEATNLAHNSTQNVMMAAPDAMSEQAMQLQVRLASEELDGPAKYSVTLFGVDGALWESGETVLTGGHNTEQMGRIDRRNMPWQQISFPVHVDENQVKAVEVAFLNDKSAPPADRNLFVSRVTLGNLAWLPIDGKQTSRCPRNKPAQRGNLFCNGKVRIESSTPINTVSSSTVSANTLRTNGVHLRHVQPSNKNGSAISYSLANVEFDGRFWNAMNVYYKLDKNGKYSMQINNHSCWPDCFTEWPECAKNNGYGTTTLSLRLEPTNKGQQCTHEKLTHTDQNLVQALWAVSQDLYNAASNSTKLRRQTIKNRFDQWHRHTNNLQRAVASAKSYKKINFEVTAYTVTDATLNETITQPVPAGISSTDREISIAQLRDKLRENNTTLSLHTLLLASPPVKASISDNSTLDEVLTDLAYQLN